MGEFLIFVKALAIGVVVAAPVGPMSLLCMRRTLTQGWSVGIASGAGIATGDAVYATVAALGLVGVSQFLLAHDRVLHLAAGLALVYLGLRAALRRPAPPAAERAIASLGPRRAFLSAWFLTLANPPTIVMFAAVFAALAPRSGFAVSTALATVAGVFAGSLLWWLALTAGLTLARHAIGRRARDWIDRGSGIVLAAVGLETLRAA
ncbi:MAG: LysE family translocator [Vulcanimicrobiaceae bacterium]